jgi:predicted enzyme related to lactoylglutathione lyase
MSKHDDFPAGTPCWVDTWQPDPRAALSFYGSLFGWDFDEAAPMPNGLEGEYFAARVAGRLVAGIGQARPSSPTVWSTYVRVDDIEQTLARVEQAGGTRLVGPLDADADGRFAVLADTTGVPFCLWQPRRRRLGVELVGEPNTWAMSSLHSTDPERAQAFYGAVFGWKLEPVPGAPFSRWRLGDEVVAVVTATDGIAVPPHWAVAFAVHDADAIAERAATLGGAVLMAPTDTPGFRSAVIADPQGGVIAVSATAG